MTDRERQDRQNRSQQGEYRDERYDSTRQPSQWQSDTPRQPTSEWQQDPSQREGFYDYGADRQRGDQNRYREDRPVVGYIEEERVIYGRSRDAGRDQGYGRRERMSGTRDRSADRQRSLAGYGDYDSSAYDAPARDYSSFTSEDYGGHDLYARGGGFSGGYAPSDSYRPSYGVSNWIGGRDRDPRRDDRAMSRDRDDRAMSRDRNARPRDDRRDYDDWRSYGEHRGFLDRAGDEIASWFGDSDAARRREQDHAMDHRGRGPSDYTRSDERIREDANEALTRDPLVDASAIRVTTKDCEVTLDGSVESRLSKRRAEDAVHDVSGVKHVQNNLRIESLQTRNALAASPAGEKRTTTTNAGSATTTTSVPSSTASSGTATKA